MALAQPAWFHRNYPFMSGSFFMRNRLLLIGLVSVFFVVLFLATGGHKLSEASFEGVYRSRHFGKEPPHQNGEPPRPGVPVKGVATSRFPKPSPTLQGFPPQPSPDSRYHDDVILGLPPSDPEQGIITDPEGLKYAILLPTFEGHFDNVLLFFQSIKCLCWDIEEVDIHVIVSNTFEGEELMKRYEKLEPCGAQFSRFKTPPKNIGRANPTINIANMYDLLPAKLRNEEGVSESNTTVLLDKYGKYSYQSLKKLMAAKHFEFDYAIWLDSEAVAVRPFSIRESIDLWVQNPVVFRSRKGDTSGFHQWMTDQAARVLGRSINSFGKAFWALESIQWIIEKAVIEDMWEYVTDAQQMDFIEAYLKHGGPFEILPYYMHIHARKLETVDSIFSKYLFLETEREMIRYGLAPGWDQIENWDGISFLERSHVMFKGHEDIRPNFSAFLSRYNQRLYRVDDLSVLPPEEMDKLLLETPIDIICSGAPDLHGWWKQRMAAGENFNNTLTLDF